MSRKQLFVDWNTLNQLIHNKDKKVIVMPGNKLWDDAGNHNSTVLVPDWADNNLFGDIEAIFDQQVQDSRDRVV
ncbi:hypothetical protein ABTN29_20675, partial [Acinetobacter baumannii]